MAQQRRLISTRLGQVASLAVAGALLVACGGDRKPHLLEASSSTNRDSELKRLHEIQALRVLNQDGVPSEWDVQPTSLGLELGGALVSQCQQIWDASDCGLLENSVLYFKCQGDTLLAMAGLNSEPVRLPDPDNLSDPNSYYTVPTQSSATNAGLAALARAAYVNVLRQASYGLSGHVYDGAAKRCLATDLDDFSIIVGDETTRGGSFAAAFVNAYHGARKAIDIELENTVAVADAQWASTPSLTLAAQRGMSGELLSRAAAAHLLVGGTPGLFGDTTRALCTSAALSPSAKAALSVFREAGVSPWDVVGLPDIQQRYTSDGFDGTLDWVTPHLVDTQMLVEGGTGTGAPSGGSVKERLEAKWGIAIDGEVADYYGLTDRDFDEARQFLAEEIMAFGRSMTATLPDSDMPTGLPLYAATATAPTPPDPAYWGALARTGLRCMNCVAHPYLSGGVEWDNALIDTLYPDLVNVNEIDIDDISFPNQLEISTLADLVDFAHSWATFLLSDANVESTGLPVGLRDPAVPELVEQALRPIELFVSSEERTGRLRIMCSPGEPVPCALMVFGMPLDGMKIIRGEDGLACATRGNIDGAPCESLDPHIVTELSLDPTTPQPGGFPKPAAPVAIGSAYMPEHAVERWYLVRPPEGWADAGPGELKSLVGFMPIRKKSFTGGTYMRDIAIVPEAERRVAEVLEPNSERCVEPAESCAGARFDDRMPLEDELASEGDGVESSWRHYLALARAAAEEADTLGQEYIEAGLALDLREEEEDLRRHQQEDQAVADMNVVQDICGSALDPTTIVAALSDQVNRNNLSEIDQGICSEDGEAGPTTRCVSGHAIRDWRLEAETNPELARIQNCIKSFSETSPITHLGDAELCVWLDPSPPPGDNFICGGEHPGYRCPDLKQGACSVPTGTTEIPQASIQGLGFFSTVDTMPPPPQPDVCDTIRALRAQPGSQDLSGVRSYDFAPVTLKSLRSMVSLRLLYGGYVELTAGGKVYRTGTIGGGPSSAWPCGTAGIPESCSADAPGLFCRSHDCMDPAGLSAANEMLVRAYLAAQLSTWSEGKVYLHLPFEFFRNVEPRDGTATALAVYTGGTPAPVEQVSTERWTMFRGDTADLLAHSFPRDYLLVNPSHPDWHVAFGNVAADHVQAGIDFFWKGMSDAFPGEGHLAAVLAGRRNPNDFPDNAGLVRFGESFATDRGCDIFTDCDRNIAYKIREEELGPRQLEMPYLQTNGSMYESAEYTYRFDGQSVLDGLELLCEASIAEEDGTATACGANAPDFQTVDDLGKMGGYLRCIGDDITRRAATSVFENVPQAAIEDLRTGGGAYLSDPGSMGEAISLLRTALLQIAASGPEIGRTVANFGEDMKALRATMKMYDAYVQIQDVQFEATVAQRAADCLVKTADAFSVEKMGGGGAAAAVTCVNSLAQIHFADKLRDLNDVATEAQREIAVADFNKRFNDHVAALETASTGLSEAFEQVRRQLGIIDGLKQKAINALNTAAWHLSYQAKNAPQIDNVLSKRKNTAHERYTRAHTNAKRMAFLAKRAIEQRLGLKLADMREDLPLVPAPATWESTVCTTAGVNYEELRVDTDGLLHYADSYIGEYVTKLENLVESYRLNYAFHEGADTAVVSLRDDVLNVRADCAAESRNLLINASRLDRSNGLYHDAHPGWYLSDCETIVTPIPVGSGGSSSTGGTGGTAGTGATGGTTSSGGSASEPTEEISLEPNCISPEAVEDLDARGAPAFHLAFGKCSGLSCGCTVGDEECGWQESSALVQTVSLKPGRYTFSWWSSYVAALADPLDPHPDTFDVLVVRDVDGNDIPLDSVDTIGAAPDELLLRLHATFDVEETGPVTIGFKKSSRDAEFVNTAGDPTGLLVAAPMLEKLDGVSDGYYPSPGVFEDSDLEGMTVRAACEDTHGELFRATRWKRGTMKLCPDGYSSDCGVRAEERPYYETSFYINQRGVESGDIFNQSGFARGNFNYRIDSIGLNFVGTGVRNCEDSSLPTTCYSAGYVPYTLAHEGPFWVRNHLGDDFRAHLFNGYIEHARGLATERYFSNPVGSSDSELMEQYLRTELQGRPLDGSFTLRVWEEEGVDFDAIQDVQIILNYRYWTRFD